MIGTTAAFRDALRAQRFLLPELALAATMLVAGFAGVLPFSATPFLLAFGILSLWLRGERGGSVGLRLRVPWGRTWVLGVGAGLGYQSLSIYVLEPAIARFTGRLPDVSSFAALEGNVRLLLVSLLVAWTLAAVGEEFVFRGYLLTRLAQVFGGTSRGWLAGVLLTSAAFGLGHVYQGASGVITAGLSGLVFGMLYLRAGRNLWVPMIAHGTVDTVGFTLLFWGRYPGV